MTRKSKLSAKCLSLLPPAVIGDLQKNIHNVLKTEKKQQQRIMSHKLA